MKSILRSFFISQVLICGLCAVSYGQITYGQQKSGSFSYQARPGVVSPQHTQTVPEDGNGWFGANLKKRYQDAKLQAQAREEAVAESAQFNVYAENFVAQSANQPKARPRVPVKQTRQVPANVPQNLPKSAPPKIPVVQVQYAAHDEWEAEEEYVIEEESGIDTAELVYSEMDTASVIRERQNSIRAAQGGAPYLRNHSPEPFPGANSSYTVTNPECEGGACAPVGSGSLLGSFGYGGVVPAFGTVGNCAPMSCSTTVYDPCNPCLPACCPGRNAADLFCGSQGQGFVLGWINGGATFSPDDNNFPNRYNDQGNEFIMNQLYLSIGRMVNKNRNQVDIGGRIDLLYGTDYYYTSALGLETYTYSEDANGNQHPVDDPRNAKMRWNRNKGDRRNGSAAMYGFSIPQLYAEIFVPIQRGVTIKAGHFYSMMGYESVMAPQNFFYSRSLTSSYGEPTTLTGIILSQQLTSRLTVYGGVTRGWDAWESANDGTSGMVGFNWDTRRGSSIAFTLHTGETSVRDGDMRTNYSLVFTQQLNPTWKYVIQHDLGVEENGSYSLDYMNEVRRDATWASIVQYLECQLTPACALGARFEWFQDGGHSRILQYPVKSTLYNGNVEVEGIHYYNFTLGMKWRPLEYLTIRPEVRWDWSNVKVNNTIGDTSAASGVFDNFTDRSQCTAGLDFVLMF